MRLKLSRDPLLSSEAARRIHSLAKRILLEIGLEVHHDEALTVLISRGFRVRNGRAHIEPDVIDTYLNTARSWRESMR